MSVELDGKNVFTKGMGRVFNTEVIECPDCVFEFASKHEMSNSEGLYECPACKEENLEVLVHQYKKALEEIINLRVTDSQLVDAQYIASLAIQDENV